MAAIFHTTFVNAYVNPKTNLHNVCFYKDPWYHQGLTFFKVDVSVYYFLNGHAVIPLSAMGMYILGRTIQVHLFMQEHEKLVSPGGLSFTAKKTK